MVLHCVVQVAALAVHLISGPNAVSHVLQIRSSLLHHPSLLYGVLAVIAYVHRSCTSCNPPVTMVSQVSAEGSRIREASKQVSAFDVKLEPPKHGIQSGTDLRYIDSNLDMQM